MPFPPLPSLLVFMAMALTICMFVVVAAGHFPADARATAFRSTSGIIVLWGTIGAVIVSAGISLYFAFSALPWYAAIIGGGLMVLVAPLLVQPFPNRVVDSRIALVVLATVALVLCLAALRLV